MLSENKPPGDESGSDRPLRPLPSASDSDLPAWMQGLDGGTAPGPDPAPQERTSVGDNGTAEAPWMAGLGDAPQDGIPPAAPVAVEEKSARRGRPAGLLAAATGVLVVVAAVAGVVAVRGLGSGAEAPQDKNLDQSLAAAGVVMSSSTPSSAPVPAASSSTVASTVSSPSKATSSSPSASTSPSGAAGSAVCPSGQQGVVVTGNGPGDTESTAGVVLAFQYAYYVERSADAAFRFTAADSAFRNKSKLQEGIDSVPTGTLHCLKITPKGDTSATVEVTESRPGVAPQVFRLEAVTSRGDDGVRLKSLRESKG